MIWFFTPYSFDKKLFEAYDAYMQLITDPNDWGCLMDGDMAFLLADFGHEIQEYIDKYPDTGMFISYASRSPYGHQIAPGVNADSDSIKTIFENTLRLRETDHLKVVEQKKLNCAPILIIKKATWDKYRNEIAQRANSANIQAVDSAISNTLTKNGEKTLLMAGMQVYHYYRQYNFSEKHILSDKLTVVIRTHDRPEMFKRAIESVRKQTHKNIDIVVGVDTPASLEYAKAYNPTRIVQCTHRARSGHTDFPANEYISKLIADINDGYILVLDDDNYISDPEGVEKLFKQIDKEICIYIIRYRYPDGRLFPNDRQFRSKIIENGGVDWASCIFHARFKAVSQSKPLYNADFYFINSLVSYCKVTKFIDLALVHTETPGNDGKTELEMIPANDPTRTHDVVYVLGTGSSWGNNEIRFSIRSFVKYFENLRNIVIVGECPVWLKGVVHIPCPDKTGINKDARMALKILAACKDYRVSENFIFCTDDTLLLQPTKDADFCGWHDGPILYDSVKDKNEHRGTTDSSPAHSEWYANVYRTGEELKRRNLPDNNYDRAHAPQPINKKEFTEILSTWKIFETNYTISNIYNNSSKIFKGCKAQNAKVYKPTPEDEIIFLTSGKWCLNYNDSAMDEQLKQWLYKIFPEASKYEIFVTEISRRATVEKWYQNGCNYAEGVAIFKNFAPKNRLLIKYFDSRQNEKSEIKLKHTLQLWLR